MSDARDEDRPEELIVRIRTEAEAEAQKIREDAKRSADDRRAALENRTSDIREKADARIAEERELIVSRTDAQIALLEGRAALRSENRIYREATDRTRDAIRELRATDDYARVLAGWIVEAALGLDADEAIVLAPQDDQPFLEKAIDLARSELEDTRPGLTLAAHAQESMPNGQGVVLRAASGRQSFSNLVEDRLRRYGTELRRIVYREVIEDKS